MSLIKLKKVLLTLLWIDAVPKTCFGSIVDDRPFTPERVFKSFNKSILKDWYTHIIMEGGYKLVHTFTLGERWFMVNVTLDPESQSYRVSTNVSGEPLTEEESRMVDFFEWYLRTSLTVYRDVDGCNPQWDIVQRRNEYWCTQKNSIIQTS